MKNTWYGETDFMASSFTSLKKADRHSSCNAFPSAENVTAIATPPKRVGSLRGGSSGLTDNRSTCSSTTSRSSAGSSRTSIYRPTSAYGKLSAGNNNPRSYRVTATPKGLQGPSPEVLLHVVEMVNNLLIPYVSCLSQGLLV